MDKENTQTKNNVLVFPKVVGQVAPNEQIPTPSLPPKKACPPSEISFNEVDYEDSYLENQINLLKDSIKRMNFYLNEIDTNR